MAKMNDEVMRQMFATHPELEVIAEKLYAKFATKEGADRRAQAGERVLTLLFEVTKGPLEAILVLEQLRQFLLDRMVADVKDGIAELDHDED